MMTTLCGESSPTASIGLVRPYWSWEVGLSPAIGRSLQHVCRYESPKVIRCCRVDSAFAPTSKTVVPNPRPSGQNPAERQYAQYW